MLFYGINAKRREDLETNDISCLWLEIIPVKGKTRGRYFSSDGIHLSSSGTKRLVDAISRHVDIVHDIHSCVFKNRRYQHGQGRQSMNNAKPYGGMNRNPYSANQPLPSRQRVKHDVNTPFLT